MGLGRRVQRVAGEEEALERGRQPGVEEGRWVRGEACEPNTYDLCEGCDVGGGSYDACAGCECEIVRDGGYRAWGWWEWGKGEEDGRIFEEGEE